MLTQFFCNGIETILNDDGSCPHCKAQMTKKIIPKDEILKQNEQMLRDAGFEV